MAFLRKPFNDELLIKTLNEAIKRAAGEKQGRASSMISPRRKEFNGMRPKSIRMSPKRHFHLPGRQ